MYIIAIIVLDGDVYEVGADVDYEPSGPFAGYMVGEPDVSAPDCMLNHSRILNTDSLPEGWSETAEDALAEEYASRCGDAADARADYLYDMSREDPDA